MDARGDATTGDAADAGFGTRHKHGIFDMVRERVSAENEALTEMNRDYHRSCVSRLDGAMGTPTMLDLPEVSQSTHLGSPSSGSSFGDNTDTGVPASVPTEALSRADKAPAAGAKTNAVDSNHANATGDKVEAGSRTATKGGKNARATSKAAPAEEPAPAAPPTPPKSRRGLREVRPCQLGQSEARMRRLGEPWRSTTRGPGICYDYEAEAIRGTPLSAYDVTLPRRWTPGFSATVGNTGRRLLLKEIRDQYARDGAGTQALLRRHDLAYARVRFMTVGDLYRCLHALGRFEFGLKVALEFGHWQRRAHLRKPPGPRLAATPYYRALRGETEPEPPLSPPKEAPPSNTSSLYGEQPKRRARAVATRASVRKRPVGAKTTKAEASPRESQAEASPPPPRRAAPKRVGRPAAKATRRSPRRAPARKTAPPRQTPTEVIMQFENTLAHEQPIARWSADSDGLAPLGARPSSNASNLCAQVYHKNAYLPLCDARRSERTSALDSNDLFDNERHSSIFV